MTTRRIFTFNPLLGFKKPYLVQRIHPRTHTAITIKAYATYAEAKKHLDKLNKQ